MRRHVIGIIALGLLAVAAVLMAWSACAGLMAALWRAGMLLAVIWLAYDDLGRLPRWTWGIFPVLLVVLVVRPKWLFFLLPVLVVLAILLRTSPRPRGREER